MDLRSAVGASERLLRKSDTLNSGERPRRKSAILMGNKHIVIAAFLAEGKNEERMRHKMEEFIPVLASPRRESFPLSPDVRDFERRLMICPHCEAQCQAIGRVKNSWYTLCKCGTYIQTCVHIDDYSD